MTPAKCWVFHSISSIALPKILSMLPQPAGFYCEYTGTGAVTLGPSWSQWMRRDHSKCGKQDGVGDDDTTSLKFFHVTAVWLVGEASPEHGTYVLSILPEQSKAGRGNDIMYKSTVSLFVYLCVFPFLLAYFERIPTLFAQMNWVFLRANADLCSKWRFCTCCHRNHSRTKRKNVEKKRITAWKNHG